MGIRVRFFASLADRTGQREVLISADGVTTAKEVWTASVSGVEMPGNTRVAINQQYADFEAPVREGDEIAFFPPVTGG